MSFLNKMSSPSTEASKNDEEDEVANELRKQAQDVLKWKSYARANTLALKELVNSDIKKYDFVMK